MRRPSSVVALWVGLAIFVAGFAAMLARPMHTAWSCVARAESGAEAEGRVDAIEPEIGLVVSIVTGPRAGEACTIRSYGDITPGTTYPILTYADRPDACELVATLERSRALLIAVSAMVAALGLGLLLAVLVIQRNLSRVPKLTTRFENAAPPACLHCGNPMEAGYLVPMSTVQWRKSGTPLGLPTLFGGLAGTFRWTGRACLDAFRCEACEIATFRFGRAGSPRRVS